MSAPTTLPAWAAPGATQDTKISRPGLGTLTWLELRKMADTRAGRWLLGIVALLVVLVIGAMAIWGDGDRTWQTYAQLAFLPIAILGPVLGVLTVTSEWSQRTALTTFTLVPQRGRIVTAKFLAAMVLATATLALILPIAGIATLVSGAADPWDMSAMVVIELLAFLWLNYACGVGFGLLFANTPVAIVSFFVLPVAFQLLSQFSAMESVGEWLDFNSTTGVLGGGETSGDEWLRIFTSALLWVVAPLVIGTVRTLRREVK
ncbi:hypothetical protein Kisp01_13650 [Kineosporia sp. NBRC 101677]|uniref:ABC transporter permease n=1 Tax=Kineosporia sp. NBRC 101677 TaxID=3032197 RepID=UPI0024A15504|nr:hypothetical protein [Kineosporia sp. NBRC 101677]GLY14349.1 hypothetical protein Kisp01_13650 [Kineosporia sp. NBRC 101677]